jgi:hypothetical protein
MVSIDLDQRSPHRETGVATSTDYLGNHCISLVLPGLLVHEHCRGIHGPSNVPSIRA